MKAKFKVFYRRKKGILSNEWNKYSDTIYAGKVFADCILYALIKANKNMAFKIEKVNGSEV